MISILRSLVTGITFLALLVLACNGRKGNSANGQNAKMDTVLIVGCQKEIRANKDVVIELRLKAIQGTGYEWKTRKDPKLLVQMKSDVLKYVTPEIEKNMPGQAVYQVLYFRVANQGTEEIELEYKRPFEETAESICLMKLVVN